MRARTRAAAALLAWACGPPSGAQPGDRLRLEYSVRARGAVLEEAPAGHPREVTLGSGEVLPALERALAGLEAGDRLRLVLPPEKAYGTRDPTLVRRIARGRFAGLGELRPGLTVHGEAGGTARSGRILRLDPDWAWVDFNHPLAGETLELDVAVVRVVK